MSLFDIISLYKEQHSHSDLFIVSLFKDDETVTIDNILTKKIEKDKRYFFMSLIDCEIGDLVVCLTRPAESSGNIVFGVVTGHIGNEAAEMGVHRSNKVGIIIDAVTSKHFLKSVHEHLLIEEAKQIEILIDNYINKGGNIEHIKELLK